MNFDYIIVGQGIAGTMLAHFLTQTGNKIFVIDDFNSSSSSNVAAGIIHPITGRRLVKTGLYDEAFPIAVETYLQLEKEFKKDFFYRIPIIEIFSSVKNKNDWELKSAESGFEKLTGKILGPSFNPAINAPFGAIEVLGGGCLKLKELVQAFRTSLLQKNLLLNEKMDFVELSADEKGIRYRDITARKIIFCEGFHAQQNPFFKSLPFQPSKGEVLIVKCKALSETEIINKSIYILPLGNRLFKIGSTFDWNNLNDVPTLSAREKLMKEFSSVAKSDFEVVDHFAAVRPTVKDRKPFVQTHPSNKNIAILNGLGTKGVLLAPYLAKKMCDMLMK